MSPEKRYTKGKTGPRMPFGRKNGSASRWDEGAERRYFRWFILITGGAFLVMLFFFVAAFFLSVRGAERTVVPQIVGENLIDALVILQERELYPRTQRKYTGNPSDKGKVISQDPEPGLYVKAGRRVTVTVSQGAILDNVEDYVGKSLDEVRRRLSSLFSTYTKLLVLREPVTFVYHDSPAGTVISQTPEAGTPLSDPVDLVLIVSRGRQDISVKLPNWAGWKTDAAIGSLAEMALRFRFAEEPDAAADSALLVTSQTPPPDTQAVPGSVVTLKYGPPASIPEESIYGLFEYTLPEYAVPLPVEVLVSEPGAEEKILFSMPHSGGFISFPYLEPAGAGIILKVNGAPVYRIDLIPEIQ